MPSKYTFSQLSPSEFQLLCRDLVQQQLSKELGFPLVFTSFREGRDQGRDAIFENKEHKIVLQCKRYAGFKKLYYDLQHIELEKIKRLSPCRYILAISLDLSSSELDKIYQLLSPYLKNSSDIVGQKMLNSLLDLYPDIKFNYPQLYLDSTDILNRILHADIYHRSKTKLKLFNSVSKYYVSSPAFIQAHKKLEQNHCVIISGDPGVGKSTMAGMLCLDYLQHDYEFIFISGDLAEADRLWQDGKKQIFLFDDFWGTPSLQELNRNENRELFRFINEIRKTPDKFLIITTREYVFRQAEKEHPEFKELNDSKFVITQSQFSDSFKIHILYNYLYYSPVEFEHIDKVIYQEHYREILSHPHFTPRLLDDYIHRKYDRTDGSYSFYFGLKKYLDNPYEYWETVYKSLSIQAQMLLLSIAITEEPILENVVFETFKRINRYRKLFEEGYDKDSYDAALAELSDSFIIVNENPDGKNSTNATLIMTLIMTSFHQARYIEFQNPSIKDFTFYYLRKREDLIEILLKSAFAFNQLFHVFSTEMSVKEQEYDPMNRFFYMEKIHLSIPLQSVIIDKVLEEFDTLPIVQASKRHWHDKVTTFHLNEGKWDNEMEKLYLLTRYFPLENVPVLKDFVINKYQEIIDTRKKEAGPEDYSDSYPYFNTHIYLSLEKRLSQVKVIKAITPYVAFDPDQTIREYYLHIRFAKEYIALYELGKLFPEAFKEVIVSDIRNIRKRIKDLIFSDINEFCWEGSSDSLYLLDELVADDLYTLADLYHFRITTKYLKSLNDVAGYELFDIDEDSVSEEEEDSITEDQEIPPAESLEMEEHVSYEHCRTLLHQLIPEWELFSEPEESVDYINRYLKKNNLDSAWRKKIIRFAEKVDYNLLLHPFSLDLLIRFFAEYTASRKTEHAFYDFCLKYHALSEEDIISLQTIAFQLFTKEIYVLRKETISLLDLPEKILKSTETLFKTPLFYHEDIWFSFFNRGFQLYLATKYISGCPEEEKKAFFQEFATDYPALGHSSEFFTHCYQIDRQFILKHLVIPELQKELDLLSGTDPKSIVKAYIQKEKPSYDYEFNENEKNFEYTGGGMGGDIFIEDLMRTLPLRTYPLYDTLEDYFNISSCKHKALKDYIGQIITPDSKSYTVDMSKEINNPAFYPALEAAEIPEIISQYINVLKNFIHKHQR